MIPETYDFKFHEHSRCGSVYLHKLNNVNASHLAYAMNALSATANGSSSDLNTSWTNLLCQ